MEIKPPSLTPTQINQLTRVVAAQGSNDGASTIPPAWQVGRLVQALVMKITGNMLYLDIQGTKVHAPKPQNLAISTGQSLLLNITSRTPSVQFNIISAQPTVKEISQQVNQPVLPQVKQSTLESFFKDISFIANRPALRPVPLPPVVNQEIRQLYKLLPAPHQLKTPAQVKSFIQNSGIFLENKLASAILAPISTKNSSSTKPQVNNDLRGQ
ncbi:MAG: hypothetical protein OEZ38_13520, partial [Gammaproteobacteria bacterium]|nr:hypothetical protein [Gammaproteobacteria bacterium]